ncbi:MAG: hypothetical protein ACFFD5_16820 [Candidatus Thorarchaeota archaeon]
MPDSDNNKLILELVPCSKCGNPFMVKKGQKESGNLVCDNCIKLEQRKNQLTNSVIESQRKIESSIKDYKNQLRLAKSQQIKQLYFDKIKKNSDVLSRSIELLKKIEETNDEKYIEEYKKLFDKMKEEYSS